MEEIRGRWHVSVIPVTVGSVKEEGRGPGQPGQKVRTYLQNHQSKKECGSSSTGSV
jgi:hypothetical protein